MNLRPIASLAASLFLLLPILTGCGVTANFPAVTDAPIAGSALGGTVRGGQAPIVGAHIYLMQASTAGYGSASTSLLSYADTGLQDSIGAYTATLKYGAWGISNDYTCTPGDIVYVLATGGNPGLSDGTNNAAISMMSVLGPCPSAGTFSSALAVTIDEATTVGGAYALAGFMSDSTHLSSPSNSLAITGITNAAANAGYLVSFGTGNPLATTPNTYGTVPQANISELSNILATCVNSDGTAPCTALFALTPNSSNVTPTNTLDAILNIAHNPSANAAALFNLSPGIGDPFPNSLTTAPNDWSLEIRYPIGSTFGSGDKMAVDSSGNLWIPEDTSGPGELSPAGKALTPTGAPAKGESIAIGPTSGVVWSAGYDGVYKGSTNLADDTNLEGTENVLAFDRNGNAWVAGGAGGYYVDEITGTTFVNDGSQAGGLGSCRGVGANAIAVDSLSDVWVLCRDTGVAIEISSSFVALSGTSGVSVPEAIAVAVDSSNRAWIFGARNSTIQVYSSAAALLGTFPTNGSISSSCDIYDLNFDGGGTVWTQCNGVLYGINSSGALVSSAANGGYSASTTSTAGGLTAVDPSGDVWVVDGSSSQSGEFIGIATPVVTPTNPASLATRP